MKTTFNGIIYIQNQNGDWIMKGDTIPRMKGDKRTKDAPRYPLIYEYEGEIKREWGNTVKRIENSLKKELNEAVK